LPIAPEEIQPSALALFFSPATRIQWSRPGLNLKERARMPFFWDHRHRVKQPAPASIPYIPQSGKPAE
jgi:hypothetical protein